MPKIIDIPYGTYLAYVDKYNVSQDYLDLTLDIAYGEWRGYFATKDRVLMPQVPSGAYRRKISYAAKTAEIVSNAIGNNKTVVAIVIGEQKYGTENKYHNITDVVDWRTCDTLSPDTRAWAEQHFDDNVYDNTPTAYDMLPYALQYAQAGLRVFPLSPCDKTPLRGTSGCKEATDDISQVTKWWFDNPFCNIGIATGNGIVVIDVDEGEGKSGEASIGQWQSINGKLPDTITSITGKGGRHIIYKSDCDYNNRVGIIPNVDIRGIGGYIVAPPSVHPNGTRYKWASTFNPTMISMVDDTVKKLIGSVAVTSTPSNYPAKPPLDIGTLNFNQGNRNDSLFRYGCSLQGKGFDDIKILEELTMTNSSKCNPPLSSEEVNKIYSSVISKPKGNNVNVNSITITTINQPDSPEISEIKIYPYVVVKDLPHGESRKTIHPQRLAAYIRQMNHYFFIESNGEKPVPYWYENGYYKQCNDLFFMGQIKHYIEIIDEELVEPAMLNKVYKLLQTDLGNTVPANKLNSDSNIINFRNGLLHLDSMELTEHSPSVYSTIQLPCSWNPSPSPCPVFDSFLSSISSDNVEMVKLLTEYIGYAVSNVPGYLTKKALFLYGPGNTGKSQYLSLLEKLVGNDNYCSITLQALEMRFGTASLFGKRVAGAADMGSATIRELEKFKSITGGDIIDFEFKGKDKFNARYNGLFIFCCNELPHFNGDRGDHVYERMILCNCTNVIPQDQRDRHLLDKLYGEREAIIYKSVMALKELLDRGGAFTEPTEVSENREAYKTENDTVRQFLVECTDLCKSDPDTPLYMQAPLTRTSEMYTYYVMWCKDNNNPYTSSQGFRKGLVNYFKAGNIKELEIYNSGIRFYKFRMKSIPILNQYYKKHI